MCTMMFKSYSTFHGSFQFSKQEKLVGRKSGQYGCWGIISLAKASRTSNYVWVLVSTIFRHEVWPSGEIFFVVWRHFTAYERWSGDGSFGQNLAVRINTYHLTSKKNCLSQVTSSATFLIVTWRFSITIFFTAEYHHLWTWVIFFIYV